MYGPTIIWYERSAPSCPDRRRLPRFRPIAAASSRPDIRSTFRKPGAANCRTPAGRPSILYERAPPNGTNVLQIRDKGMRP